jgi:hypothetical protein
LLAETKAGEIRGAGFDEAEGSHLRMLLLRQRPDP